MKLIDLIMEYLEVARYSLKKRTLFNYFQNINNYVKYDIGESDICILDNNILNNYILSKYKGSAECGALSSSTLKITKTVVNRALNYAYEKRYIDRNVKITTNLKKTTIPKVESLTTAEARKIEKDIIVNKRYYSYGVVLCLYTGLRIGELLALKWKDVDLKNKIIGVKTTSCDISFENKMYHIEDLPKSASSLREIPLTHELVTLLKDLKAYQKGKSEYVVSRPNGKQIFIRSYQDSFARLLKRLKIRHYGFHSLRHTFATRCYKLGMDIKTLSELLGHSSPAVTLKIYVHTDMELKRNALNMVAKKIRQQNA